LERKNGWTLTELAGDTSVTAMQNMLQSSCWDPDEVRDDVRERVVAGLGERDGGRPHRSAATSAAIGVAGSWPARSIADPTEIAYYVCFGPRGTRLRQLVRVAGTRWSIEDLFQTVKNETGWTTTRSAATTPGTPTSPCPWPPWRFSP
jgi:hypothetical protein